MSAINAAEQLKNFGNKIRPLIEAIEYLENLGSLEQAMSEANSKKDAAVKSAGEAESALALLKENIQTAEGKLRAYEAQAEQTKKAGEEKYQLIVSGAKSEAGKMIAEAEGKVAKIGSIISEKNSELAALNTRIVERETDLKNLEETIKQTKARISAL